MATAPSSSPSPSSSRTSDVRYDHLQSLSANLKEHLTSKAFSDITLVCGDHTFDCHKVVLSSGCEFFRDLLVKQDLNLIDVSEVKADVMQQVVFFIYTGTCDITIDAIKDFLDIATKWKITSMFHLCFKFIRENCTISNAGVFYSLLLQYQDQPTLDVVSYFIREHFTEMFSRRSFGTIPIPNFCDLLEHDEINVKNEDEVFDSLLELVEDQHVDGGSKVRYDVIRFQHMSKDYLEGSVRSHPLMREVPQRDLIRDAIRYKYSKSNIIPRKKRYWKMQQHQDTKAESSKQVNTIVSRHPRLYCIDEQKHLCIFSENDNGWNVMLKVKAFIDEGTSIENYKSGFVLVGAGHSRFGKQVSYVDLSTHTQRRLPDLQENTLNPGVLSVGDDLYVIGGSESSDQNERNLDSVFKLSNGNKHWTYLPKLKTPMKSPQCVLLDEAIYVFGRNWNEDDDTMLRLKLNDRSWTLCKKIPDDESDEYFNHDESDEDFNHDESDEDFNHDESDEDFNHDESDEDFNYDVFDSVHSSKPDALTTYDDQLVIVKPDRLIKFDSSKNKWTTEFYARPLEPCKLGTCDTEIPELYLMNVLKYEGKLCVHVEHDGQLMSYDAHKKKWLPLLSHVPDLMRSRMLFAC